MGNNIWAMMTAGGPIMFILAALSVLSLTVIVAKILQLLPVVGGNSRRDAAIAQWAQGEREAAKTAISGGRAPADKIMAYAMAAIDAGAKGPALEQELTRHGNAEVTRLSGSIRLLELIAMVSPLLGLLGTVLGMIQSFQDLAQAEGAANASVLAGGIWLALLTTAAGLIVAIPAAIAAGLFAARVDRAAQKIESAVGQILFIENSGVAPGSL
jgi:biopolymer transport protein ExbB